MMMMTKCYVVGRDGAAPTGRAVPTTSSPRARSTTRSSEPPAGGTHRGILRMPIAHKPMTAGDSEVGQGDAQRTAKRRQSRP